EWLLRYLLIFGTKNTINLDHIILNFRYHEDSKSTKHQNSFESEADSIYLSLARHVNYVPAINSLQNLQSGNSIQLEFSYVDLNRNRHLLERSLNYNLFKRFVEKY